MTLGAQDGTISNVSAVSEGRGLSSFRSKVMDFQLEFRRWVLDISAISPKGYLEMPMGQCGFTTDSSIQKPGRDGHRPISRE